MAGGTLCSTEKGFTVRVPELRSSTTLAVTRCEKHGKAVLCLDNAFSLIEGHPRHLGLGRVEWRWSRSCNPKKERLGHPPVRFAALSRFPERIENEVLPIRGASYGRSGQISAEKYAS